MLRKTFAGAIPGQAIFCGEDSTEESVKKITKTAGRQ
jgi:hypothetical protein